VWTLDAFKGVAVKVNSAASDAGRCVNFKEVQVVFVFVPDDVNSAEVKTQKFSNFNCKCSKPVRQISWQISRWFLKDEAIVMTPNPPVGDFSARPSNFLCN
jgi:hypothetical protein